MPLWHPVRRMVAASPVSQTFSTRLRAELDARNIGARTLARMIVAEHGGTLEDRRRTIVRWLSGATPVKRNREIVEDVLGLSRDALRGDEDEEHLLSPVVLQLDVEALIRDLEARVVKTLLSRMEAVR